MKIIIAGLGLMGGSMAKALSFSGAHQVLAIEKDDKVVNAALSSGVIDGVAKNDDFRTADIIYICLYPESVVKFLLEKAPFIGKNTLVTDICGIKCEIYPTLREIALKYGFSYVGSHPMAGREKNSYFASDSSLFLGASYIIITEDENNRAKWQLIEELAVEMGFKSVKLVNPEEHDLMIAFTSQLPHLISCAYVKSPRCLKHNGFSAGSFRDMSRVADINAKLWTELFLMNRTALLQEAKGFVENLNNLVMVLENEDEKKLNQLLDESRQIKSLC